jgi:ferredoxin-NADP reductase
MEDAVFRRELEQLASRRRAKLFFVVGSRAELGHDPLTAEMLAAQVPGLAKHDIYLCGPSGLTDHATEELRAAGVRRRQIHHESFEF